MKRENISQIISRIDEKYIDEATAFTGAGDQNTPDRPSPLIKQTRRFRWGAIAACLALIAVIGSAAFAFAAEAREYSTAVAYFEENGLTAEGLSRSEVKAVYRDITGKRFSYGKTADVIRPAVPGW